MKTKATLIATATVFALIAGQSTARAGDEAIAAIGGFIGGVIVGSITSDNHHGSSVVIEAGYGRGSGRHYDRGNRHDRYDRHYDQTRRYGRHDSRGHTSYRGRWEYRTIRKWVPGYWTYTRDRCGDRRRVWNRGYHVRTQVRVWVSFGEDHGGSRRHRG